MSQTILIIDDEKQMLRLLELTLSVSDYRVLTATDGNTGLQALALSRPDCVILDLGLPDMDGMQVLERLREWSTIPVLVVSARGTEEDVVLALDHGANDYLVKPFRTAELLARVRAALRTAQADDALPVLHFDALSIDLTAHLVRKNGHPVKLTSTEYAIMKLFARNSGRVLTHSFVMRTIWGPDLEEETQYLRVYINQLRKKLEDDPAHPHYIVTESGIGYRFWPDEHRTEPPTT